MKTFRKNLSVALLCVSILYGVSVAMAENSVSPQKNITSVDEIQWIDGKDLLVEGKGWIDTESFYDRLPAKAKGKVPGGVFGLSHDSAGLCVRFTTDAPNIQVRWTVMNRVLAKPHMAATSVSGVDLYAKDESGKWTFVGNGRPINVSNTTSFTPPPAEEFRLYFLSSEDMLGDDGEGTVDGCHANDLGMMRQAAVYVKAIAPHLAEGRQY